MRDPELIRVAQELIRISADWDRAMVKNDSEEIGRFMSDDWIIIGSDGRVSDKASFLGLVKSGELAHDVMESHDMHVRVYGETALVIARGRSGGTFRGERFHSVERVSCLYVRQHDEWKCVSTHLSPIAVA